MSTDRLAALMADIASITNTTAGTSGASAGIFGITSAGGSTVNDLKRTAVEFAVAYRNNPHSPMVLDLSIKVDGLLSTLQVLSVLSTEKYDHLVAALHGIMDLPT